MDFPADAAVDADSLADSTSSSSSRETFMLTVVFIGNIMLTVMCKWTQMLTLVQTGKSVLALMFTRIHVSTYGEIRSDADVFADPFANPGKFHADFDVHVDSYAVMLQRLSC